MLPARQQQMQLFLVGRGSMASLLAQNPVTTFMTDFEGTTEGDLPRTKTLRDSWGRELAPCYPQIGQDAKFLSTGLLVPGMAPPLSSKGVNCSILGPVLVHVQSVSQDPRLL